MAEGQKPPDECLYGRRYCPQCGKAAKWEEGKKERRGVGGNVIKLNGLVCSRCGHIIDPDRLERLPICQPIIPRQNRRTEKGLKVSD